MCFENIPCKALCSGKKKKKEVWNGSQMMWDSFQTSAIIAENLHFLCFSNPSCVHRSVPAYACFSLRMPAHVHGLIATLVILFPKFFFSNLKCYIFYFNTLQVNLISDWALNWHWALKFEHHWGTRV